MSSRVMESMPRNGSSMSMTFGLLMSARTSELFITKSATILREIRKRTRKLRALQLYLAHPAPTGRPPTIQAVTKQIEAILIGRHMKELIRTEVTKKNGTPRLSCRMDQTAWSRLHHTLLGKTILFTDQAVWGDEAIVRA